ncbi:GNAT family N-acetyltransferase [candidate division KSB1 bacterium]|nr:GNAT family N-acetyltransferase [candidate division KSB1 bacterium]
MQVEYAKLADFNALIALSREVELLFGPMANEPTFQAGLKKAILEKTVYCIRPVSDGETQHLIGAIIISREQNEIAWLVVSEKYKRRGYGKQLLEFAMHQLNRSKDIFVQTFDKTVSAGKTARKLYTALGFIDDEAGGLNPAGIPTVIMKLPAQQQKGTTK